MAQVEGSGTPPVITGVAEPKVMSSNKEKHSSLY